MKGKLMLYTVKILKFLWKMLVCSVAIAIVISLLITYGCTKCFEYGIEPTIKLVENNDGEHRRMETMADYKNSQYGEYVIKNTLVMPYFERYRSLGYKRVKPYISREFLESFTYGLSCQVYQSDKTNEKVVINYVCVDPVSNVTFEGVKTQLNTVCEFDDENSPIKMSIIDAMRPITDKDMNLNEESVLNVTINVTIGEGNSAVTESLVYNCSTTVMGGYSGIINAT